MDTSHQGHWTIYPTNFHKFKFYVSVLLLMIKINQSVHEKSFSFCNFKRLPRMALLQSDDLALLIFWAAVTTSVWLTITFLEVWSLNYLNIDNSVYNKDTYYTRKKSFSAVLFTSLKLIKYPWMKGLFCKKNCNVKLPM